MSTITKRYENLGKGKYFLAKSKTVFFFVKNPNKESPEVIN